MKKFCIVIPIYTTPSLLEHETIKNLFNKIQPTYDVYYVCPERLKDDKDIKDLYLSLAGTDTAHIQFIYFADKYFKSEKTYSQLCLLCDFYKAFNDYEYMYIVQPDVWIFRDEFEHWCDFGYDYIGAPILSKASLWRNVPNVGNGGFSLRKISTFIDMCDKNGVLRKTYKDIDDMWENVSIEDMFICDTLRYRYYLDIPTVQDALLFAWDQSIDHIYEKITKKIPFGAHAVGKHNISFWKDIIPELNKKEIIKDEITVKWKSQLINMYGDKYIDKINEIVKAEQHKYMK